jgi:Immunity protein 26
MAPLQWDTPVKTPTVNLRVLRPSRTAPTPGDVFAILPADGRFLFGRVIADDADVGFGNQGILVYIYAARADAKSIVLDALDASRLLVGPIVTNRQPWTRGYFERIDHAELTPGDRLRHCFRDASGRCVDEYGRPVAPDAHCGDRGLHSYRSIDDEIHRALGIPLAPE